MSNILLAPSGAPIVHDVIGRLRVPDFNAVTFLPGQTAPRQPHYQAVVSYVIRRPNEQGQFHVDQADWNMGLVMTDGLQTKWRESEALQREFACPDAFLQAFGTKIVQAATWHNERVDVGGNMVSKSFWGSTATVANTVGLPTRIAVSSFASFAAAHGDLSLGTATGNSTTNEYTTAGLVRTGALTPGSVTAPSSLNGTFSLTLANTFTCSVNASSFYGTGLVDNTTTAFNMYAEALLTSGTLQSGDTLSVTWTINN